jgi:hypothetical protein
MGEDTEALLNAGKKTGIEENKEETKYMIMPRRK